MHYWGQPYMGGWSFGLGGGIGIILTIAFWALVIFLILALIFKAFGADHKYSKKYWKEDDYKNWKDNKDSEDLEEKSALRILKIRYAKGEITKKEFEEMKKVIS